jgi:hypothetical protein
MHRIAELISYSFVLWFIWFWPRLKAVKQRFQTVPYTPGDSKNWTFRNSRYPFWTTCANGWFAVNSWPIWFWVVLQDGTLAITAMYSKCMAHLMCTLNNGIAAWYQNSSTEEQFHHITKRLHAVGLCLNIPFQTNAVSSKLVRNWLNKCRMKLGLKTYNVKWWVLNYFELPGV